MIENLERAFEKAAAKPVGDRAARAAARVAAAADERGQLEVAFCRIDSPLGPLFAAATAGGLVKLAYVVDPNEALEELAEKVSTKILEHPRRLDDVRRQLDLYFEGRRRTFDLPVDWALTRGFFRRVLNATARIPYGEVATYREVAGRAGNPRATRAAGNALGSNPIAIIVPCHRVVRTGGDLGGYGGGLEKKAFLLELEGALPHSS